MLFVAPGHVLPRWTEISPEAIKRLKTIGQPAMLVLAEKYVAQLVYSVQFRTCLRRKQPHGTRKTVSRRCTIALRNPALYWDQKSRKYLHVMVGWRKLQKWRFVNGTLQKYIFSPLAQQPNAGHGRLIREVSRPHKNNTPQSVGLLRTSDRPVAETSTSHHIILTRDRYPRQRRDSNPLSQQAIGRRPSL